MDCNELISDEDLWTPLEQRFWSKVTKTENCWLWTAAAGRGYGQFRAKGVLIPAHRFSYTQEYGDPGDLHVDHVKSRGCTSRLCVRPSHLEAVTQAENNRRSIERIPRDFCNNGLHPKVGRTCPQCRADKNTRRRDRRNQVQV